MALLDFSKTTLLQLFPIAILFIIYHTETAAAAKSYVGCAKDNRTRILNTYKDMKVKKLNSDKCMNICSQQSATLFGLQYRRQCFCGVAADLTTVEGMLVDETECKMKCRGNKTEKCGAKWRMNVYQIIQ